MNLVAKAVGDNQVGYYPVLEDTASGYIYANTKHIYESRIIAEMAAAAMLNDLLSFQLQLLSQRNYRRVLDRKAG